MTSVSCLGSAAVAGPDDLSCSVSRVCPAVRVRLSRQCVTHHHVPRREGVRGRPYDTSIAPPAYSTCACVSGTGRTRSTAPPSSSLPPRARPSGRHMKSERLSRLANICRRQGLRAAGAPGAAQEGPDWRMGGPDGVSGIGSCQSHRAARSETSGTHTAEKSGPSAGQLARGLQRRRRNSGSLIQLHSTLSAPSQVDGSVFCCAFLRLRGRLTA